MKWGSRSKKHLAKRRDIFITTTEKGGAVFMETEN